MADILTKRYWDKKPLLGSQLNFGHPLAQGLVGCWLMNEGGGKLVSDLTRKNNAIITGTSINWASGLKGRVVNFPIANNNYINVGNLNPSALTNATFVMLFYPTNWNDIISGFFGRTVWDAGSFYFRQNFGNTRIDFGVNGNTPENVTGFNNIDNSYLNKWLFLAVTYDQNGKFITQYLNGQMQKNSMTTMINLLTTNMLIGAEYDVTARCMRGSLAYTYIYNRALSPQEIQSLYVAPYQMIKPRSIVFGYAAAEPPPAGGVTPYGYLSTNKGFW